MAFLKINRFAGILAVACAFLFPAYAEAYSTGAINTAGIYYSWGPGNYIQGGYVFKFGPTEASNIINTATNGTWSGVLNMPGLIGSYTHPTDFPPYEVGEEAFFQFQDLPPTFTTDAQRISVYIFYKGKEFVLQGKVSGYDGIYVSIFPYNSSYPYNGIVIGEYLTNSVYNIEWTFENTIGTGNSYFNNFGLGFDNDGGGSNGNAFLTLDTNLPISGLGTPPPPPEPPEPPHSEIVIDGLTCNTNIIPDIANATWYNNFMNNTGFLSNVDDDGWIRFFSWSGSIYDLPEAQYVNRAALYYADQTAGGNFASGSLNYPGTARTTIRGGNKSPLLLSFSDSEVKPNVVQWHGVNSVALGYAGTVQFQNTQLQNSPEVPISASGGIATAVISGNERINKVLLNYSSGFNGFRYGVAPTTSKSACSYKYNLCEWSIEGANTVCQSGNLVGGIPAGNCVITGSGSVYGSGACVPETNASGAIIPPVLVPGVTVYDSEGNPVGNIYENESVTPDLSCDYSTTDGWTDKIGKTFQCVTSFFSSSAKLSKDGVSGITGASQQLGESIKQDIGTNTGTTATGSSNKLLNSLYGVDEGVKEYKYVKLSYALLIFTVTVFLIVMLSIVLKSGISNIKN